MANSRVPMSGSDQRSLESLSGRQETATKRQTMAGTEQAHALFVFPIKRTKSHEARVPVGPRTPSPGSVALFCKNPCLMPALKYAVKSMQSLYRSVGIPF